MKPTFQENSVEIYQGDCREVLRSLPDESVHCVVTSPPYWGLRDYGTASWDGGSADCDHIETLNLKRGNNGGLAAGATERGATEHCYSSAIQFRQLCGKCGATRIDRQIGLEDSPVKYISTMREVFAEVRRVLRSDGTLWLNMGDSYAAGGQNSGSTPEKLTDKQRSNGGCRYEARKAPPGLKPKDLVGIPWMLAFALREDGWYLRQDIIWSKPNPMPESVTDRCTKAHEYIFLLSKSERYFYNQEAVREAWSCDRDDMREKGVRTGTAYLQQGPVASNHTPGKNSRMFQDRDPQHSAERKKINKPRGWATGDDHSAVGWATAEKQGATEPRYDEDYESASGRNKRSVWTIATAPFPEAHFATFPEDLIKPCILAGCVEGGTVLDPFGGSGTTAKVARELHCKAIMVELNPDYIQIAARRLSQHVFNFSENRAGGVAPA